MSEIRGRELRSGFYQNLSSVYVPGQICLYQVLFAAVDKKLSNSQKGADSRPKVRRKL